MKEQNGAATEETVRAIAQDMVSKAPFRVRAGVAEVGAAYAVQDALTRHLEGNVRGAVAGYKIAANSAALMQRFGIDEPGSGRVFADQLHESPAEQPADAFRQFAYEPEITAVMGETLPAAQAPFSRERVAAAIDRFVPSLELLDLRDMDRENMNFPEAVAQNITNAGAVIGGPGVAPGALDVAAVRTEVTIDGQPECDVTGAAPQEPLEAVVWLANHLAQRGIALEAGQVVLCGTHAPMRPVAGAAEIAVRMSGLGSVSVRLAG